ncbi:MAG: transglutaminase domain-containing protein [Lachnospiraceae bacterium]|nr:transglutaminase domain-containing protein [Lachnospiraceae bacterium]
MTPCNSIRVRIQNNHNNDQENTSISRTGVFQREDGFLYANNKYTVDYYDETLARGTWIATGGSNCDVDTAATILWELKTLLEENKEEEYAKVAEVFYKEAEEARYYAKLCAQNTQQIPESVAGLAAEITKDCVYDWEKATALQNYFAANDFVYDLSYRASDDSVEYFLFEGKTGTCSDFASAYVLMARSVGLIVRYVEGFVPEAEYNGEYVVRTQNGHAYPEVYIPNIGFAVYEATRPARIADSNSFGSGITAFFMAIGVRILLVFTVVCAVLLAGLFIHFIAAPSIKETYFLRKIKKASPEQAVVSLYKRIVKTHARAVIQKGGIYTPYEYALQFEETMNYDISELTYLVEDAVYTQRELGVRDSIRAKELYQAARKAIREKQREGKKGKRRA